MSNKDVLIKVCMGTGGIALGGTQVIKEFEFHLKEEGIEANVEKHCSMHKVGCRGLCARDVLVDVLLGDTTTTYQYIKPEMVERIVKEHVIEGNPVEEWMVDDNYHDFHNRQTKIVLSDCGKINPESIDAYIEVGGYEALKKVLGGMSQEKTIDIISKSGLRGRGGAGFPTGRKWDSCRKTDAPQKYIICNADEGDPGAFMDRAILEGNPHSVIEGMIIGGYAIGSDMAYIYVRAEYPTAIERLNIAIKHAKERNFLGKNILGSGYSLEIELYQGAGAFVCGESTALMRSIEGKRGMPRPTPPNSVYQGLWNMPSVLNNVETFSNVPHIIRKGSDWFASYGTEKSKGTKAFALTGKINNTGLIEVPMGMPLKEIIYGIGGGIDSGKQLKAVQTGGPSGGCIPASMVDVTVDFESLAELGSIVGSGGMIVLDEDDCMVNIAQYFLHFTQEESCGKCVPCRVGTKRLFEILERITSGQGQKGDIERLQELGSKVVDSSLCGLGKSAPNPILSTIEYFREEYEAHLEGKCPAKVCKLLLIFSIIEDTCTGCGACKRACPSDAISGSKKKPHVIDQELCIKCGSCFDVCKFKAVHKE
jgi:NADH-quinone oxidoreductase subunit F